MKIISYQVIRVQKFTKNSLGKIGAETERTSRSNRNQDIDVERTPLNLYFKKSTNGMNSEWKSIVEKTNATFKDTKKSVAFEGIIITSDKAFFEKLGYVQGEQPPTKVLEFFNDCYKFVLREVGYHGTDENILSAVIHFDETTPHLQLYYVPIVDQGKRKFMQKVVTAKFYETKKVLPFKQRTLMVKEYTSTTLSLPLKYVLLTFGNNEADKFRLEIYKTIFTSKLLIATD